MSAPISSTEAAMLEALIGGAVLSRNVASRIWYGVAWHAANRNSFRVRICHLRKKIGARGGELIHEPGRGFWLDAPGRVVARHLLTQYREAQANKRRLYNHEYYLRNIDRVKERSAEQRRRQRADVRLLYKLRRNGIPMEEARAEVARAFAMEAAE